MYYGDLNMETYYLYIDYCDYIYIALWRPNIYYGDYIYIQGGNFKLLP